METTPQKADAPPPSRVAFYVDGCNLYYGLRQSGLRRYYWLDLASLAQNFLKPGQTLVATKYFTAIVKGDPGKSERHTTYIDALNALGRVEVVAGFFQQEPVFCGNCRIRRPIPKEKQTDTNIATSMVVDAYQDAWDVAFLVWGDADLVPPIAAIRGRFPEKRVFVASPPGRVSGELRGAAHSAFYVNPAMLGRSQLPDEVVSNGVRLSRPEKWQ